MDTNDNHVFAAVRKLQAVEEKRDILLNSEQDWLIGRTVLTINWLSDMGILKDDKLDDDDYIAVESVISMIDKHLS